MLRSVRGMIVGMVAGTLLGAGAIAYAATIPDENGVIHACFKSSNGAVRIVESSADCANSEAPIEWNQAGPQGPQGDPGPQGPPGSGGATDPVDLFLATRVCRGCDLAGENFSGLDLRFADLSASDLTGADLSGADLTNARLDVATLDGVTLAGANLRNAIGSVGARGSFDFGDPGPSMVGADLTGVSWRNGFLDATDISGTTFEDASLVDLYFENVVGTGVSFENADLTGMGWGPGTLTDSTLLGAVGFQQSAWSITLSNVICPNGSNSDGNGGSCPDS